MNLAHEFFDSLILRKRYQADGVTLMAVDNRRSRSTIGGVLDSVKSNLIKIAWVLCGIWLVLWVAKKIGGTAFLVLVGLTWIGYWIVDSYLELQLGQAKLAYATAGRNERANQHLLAATCEGTRQARWKFYTKLVCGVLILIKLLPVLIHWFH